MTEDLHGFMERIGISLCLFALVSCVSAQTASQKPKQFVIAATTVLDGKGGVLHDTRIVIEGSKIVRIDPNAGPVTYDLRGLTVLPGWIDAHVHISWIFGPDGKNAGGGVPTSLAALAANDVGTPPPAFFPSGPKIQLMWTCASIQPGRTVSPRRS